MGKEIPPKKLKGLKKKGKILCGQCLVNANFFMTFILRRWMLVFGSPSAASWTARDVISFSNSPTGGGGFIQSVGEEYQVVKRGRLRGRI